MLRRKMYADLLSWKAHKGKECLLIKGARQTGKTYLVRQLGSAAYKNYIEINFQKEPSLKHIFDGDLTAQEIYKRMSMSLKDIHLEKGKTLIFLDEIQKCASARTSLKFLAEDGRYDVIASGSLLGLAYGEDADKEVEEVESIPVGYERTLYMYPLDFEEFLWGLGYSEEAISELARYYEKREKIPSFINEQYENLLKEYLVTGGMPEVVDDFVTHQDFSRVQKIQEKILLSYIDDISMHAKKTEAPKARKCYLSIPRQLAKENRKFKYSEVEARGSSRKFMEGLQWLIDAEMVRVCRNVSSPELPLNVYEKEDEFKIYMNDTGLLMSMNGFETKKALLEGKLKGFAKGGIYENFLAQTLISKGHLLHYYRPSEEMELEFLIESSGIVPIEVKAGNHVSKSFNAFIDAHQPHIAYKFIKGNIGLDKEKLSLPHYMAMFL